MRRRKNKKVYIKSSSRSVLRKLAREDSAAQQMVPSLELRQFSFANQRKEHSPSNTVGSPPSGIVQSFSESDQKPLPEAAVVRKVLQKITGTNAVLSWAVSVLGYHDVRNADESEGLSAASSDAVRVSVCVLSLLQISLIVCYFYCCLQYSECVRVSLRLSPLPVDSLWRSPRMLANCTLECAFHLLILPPRVSLQTNVYVMDTYSLLSVNDLIYILILLRNYHSLRFLFWYSDFSSKRIRLFSRVASVDFTNLFVLRCYLAAYSLKLVFGIYGFIVAISGLIVFVLEKGAPGTSFDNVYNGLWFVSYTQSSIGYGEIVPTTFFGRLPILFNCLFGPIILSLIIGLASTQVSLNLTECTMYSELAYAKFKRKYEKESVLLMQKWWRFMIMRQSCMPNAHIIIAFYSQLRVYRGIITSAQRVKDRRFERQIAAFDASTSRRFREALEYLQPIGPSDALVPPTQTTEIIRTQYRIKLMIRKMYKATRRYAVRRKSIDATSVSSVSLSNSPEPGRAMSRASPSPRVNTKGLAKAKLRAHQKLIGRLLRDEATSPLTPESASPSILSSVG